MSERRMPFEIWLPHLPRADPGWSITPSIGLGPWSGRAVSDRFGTDPGGLEQSLPAGFSGPAYSAVFVVHRPLVYQAPQVVDGRAGPAITNVAA